MTSSHSGVDVRLTIDLDSLAVDFGHRQLPLTSFEPEPWRNGLGTTRTLARGDSWRVSVATVADGAVFSRFPGVERLFIPFLPDAIDLWASESLTVDSCGAIRFNGELPVTARVSGDEALAVNLMVAKGNAEMTAERDTGLLRVRIRSAR